MTPDPGRTNFGSMAMVCRSCRGSFRITSYNVCYTKLLRDTYFQYAMPSFKAGITEMVTHYPWTFALAMFAVSVVINSQAATCIMMLPVGLGLGLSPALLIGLMPASYGYFFIPNYPSDIATVNFDITGTTKIRITSYNVCYTKLLRPG